MHFRIEYIEVKPVNSLCHSYEVDTLIGKRCLLRPLFAIGDSLILFRVSQLWLADIRTIYFIKTLSQLYRDLAIASAAVPGGVKVFYMAVNEIKYFGRRLRSEVCVIRRTCR